jgi:hypothetical protein
MSKLDKKRYNIRKNALPLHQKTRRKVFLKVVELIGIKVKD